MLLIKSRDYSIWKIKIYFLSLMFGGYVRWRTLFLHLEGGRGCSFMVDSCCWWGFEIFEFSGQGRRGGATARILCVYFEWWWNILRFLLFFYSFKVKGVGGGPTASNFFYSLRSPYGAPFRRSANYAVQQQQKVTKKCRKLNGEA